jgi:hypothetical protein
MAKGSKAEFDKIKATPVLDFWKIFDLWNARQKAELEAAKQQNKK